MASEIFKPDANFKAGGVVGGYSSVDAAEATTPTKLVLRINPTTMRLLVDVNGATTVTDGEAVNAADTGTLFLGTDGSNYQIVKTDADGNLQVDVLSGGGGGTQYQEDAAHVSGDTGTLALAVRKDTAAQVAQTDGDYTVLITDANGRLHVLDQNSAAILAALQGTIAVSNAGLTELAAAINASKLDINIASDGVGIGGGTQYAEDAAHVSGDTGTLALVVRKDTAAQIAGLDGDYSALITDANGRLHVLDQNSATILSTLQGTLTVGSHAVTNVGTFVVQENGAALTALQLIDNLVLAEDAAHQSADPGIQLLAIRDDTPAVVSGTEGDYEPLHTDGTGRLWTDPQGNIAHDGIDSGNPIKFGGRSQEPEAQPEEVADNDRVDALFDRNGYLRVRGDLDPSFADINDSTSGDNTIIAAQAAGKRIAVWAILIVSDGTTDVRWEDGAAGTAFTGQVPLQAREGYSISAGGVVPLFVGSAATLLNLELTAAVNVHGFVSYTVIDD